MDSINLSYSPTGLVLQTKASQDIKQQLPRKNNRQANNISFDNSTTSLSDFSANTNEISNKVNELAIVNLSAKKSVLKKEEKLIQLSWRNECKYN